MNTARTLSIATIVALLAATGFAHAATGAKTAVEAAAPVVTLAAAAKKPVVMKKQIKHHAKKKSAHVS